MNLLMRFLREPLLHFFIIGGFVFLAFAAIDETGEAPADVIIIVAERIDQLATGFKSVWKRDPTEKELETLIEEDVREEVYYRGALALGLDKNDTIVRRRMNQKMAFLLDTGAHLQEPTKEELHAYFITHQDAYRREQRLAFEQIYFGEAPKKEIITQSLEALQGVQETSPANLGVRSLLPAGLSLSPKNAVDGVFGTGFFEKLASLSPAEWSGPVASAYGVHIVRVLEDQPIRTPPLSEVREAVLKDWRLSKAQEIRDRDYADRRMKYVVEIRRREDHLAGKQ